MVSLKPTGKLASTQVSCLLKSSGHGGQLTPFSSLLPAEPRAVGTQSSSTHGRGHWTASLDILSSTRSSPSWDQPLRLGGRSPISQIHSHQDLSLMPQHWGTRAVASNLSPPVVTYLRRCSVSAAQSSSLGKIPKASGWSLVPSFAAPSSSSLCSCPLLLQPPRAAPPFLLPALPVLCLLSESQARDWGEGEDPRRGSASDARHQTWGAAEGREEQGGFSLCEGNFIFNRC